jgi:hypothetical protein
MHVQYQCKYPAKYAGDSTSIFARSKWELLYMSTLDGSNMVLKWMSEPKQLNIKYLDPVTKKVQNYWPDFLIQYTNGDIEIVEIKPMAQSVAEKAMTRFDKLSLITNSAKWAAASAFAKKIGAKFRVVTEQQLYRKKSTNSTRTTRGTQ